MQTLMVGLEIKSPKLKKQLEMLLHSVEGLQTASADRSTPDLLIYELGADPAPDFERIQELLSEEDAPEVFVMAGSRESDLLLKALRAGVKEFFPTPIKEREVREALEQFRGRKEARSNSRGRVKKNGTVIDVFGSKGGVGTTTLAVNLASYLAEIKGVDSVALLDMNLLFGEIPLFLDIRPNYHWGEVTDNLSRLDATFLKNILARHSSGVYVMPSPGYLNSHPAASPQLMDRLLTLMRTMFDFVVVDAGQALDEGSLKVLQLSDMVLLVSILSLPCLSNTKRLLESFRHLGHSAEKAQVVINRYLKRSDVTLKDAESSLHQKVFWTLPNDYKTTVSAINKGRPLSQAAAKAPVSKQIRQLAEKIAEGNEGQKQKRRGLFKRSR